MKNWKNLSKRGLSLLVCLMMCLSMLPGVAYADEVDVDVHDHAHDSEVVVLADEGETMPCTHPSTHKDVVGHGLLGTTFTRQICDECGAWYWDYYLFDIRIGLFHRVSDWFGKGVVPVPPTEENCTHPQELRVYRDNNDGATHRVVCGVEGCSTLIDASVPHAYTLENATKCVCGAVLVVPGCDHTNTSLVATDGTHHNVVCDDCDEIITANVACSVTWPSTTYCVDTTVTKNCECGNTLSHEYKGAGHTYTGAWTWAEDGKTATLTLTCGRDATHTHTEANVTATADGTPSCGEDVEITYTVSVVYEGKTYTDNTTRTVIATGEHSYESGKYDKDADKHYAACDNCTHKEPGEAHTFEDSICTVCGYGCEHSWSNWSPAADSKCSGMVDQSKSCEICGKTESQSVPATGNHTPGEAVEENVVAATCTKAGSYDEVVYCSVCNEELSRNAKTIDKLDHTAAEAVVENKVDATCTEDGSYDEVVYCSVCNTEISRTAKVIDKLAHTPGEATRDKEVPATCAKEGNYDEVVNCTVCGWEISRQYKTIAKLPHTAAEAVVENKVDATCTEDGSYDEVVYCSECKTEISRETKTIEATGHTPESDPDTAVVAVCSRPGKEADTVCSVCGKTLKVGVDIFVPHTPVKVEEAASCTEAGVTGKVVCDVCGAILEEGTVIPATGHTEVIDEAVAPGCETEGKAAGKHCSVCGEVLAAQTVIPATGHTVAIDEAVAPTCTETGLTEGFHCSVCDEVLAAQETVPATGHTEEVIPAVAATCEETGLTAGVRCSVCEEILVAQTETPATDHDWSGWFIDVEPTLDEEGHAYRVCRNDAEHREEAVLPQLPDPNETNPDPDPENPNPWTLDENASYAPTCTEDGRNVYTSVYGTVIVVIPATGHAWGEWIIDLDPTVETEGHAYRICGNNAAHVDEAVLPQLPDPGETNPDPDPENPNPWTLDEDASYAPTCTEDGANVYTSEYGTVIVVIPALGHIWDDGVVTQMPTPTVDGIRTYTCERCGETRNEAIPYASTNPTLPAPDPDEDGEGGGAGTGTVTIDEEETPLADLPFEDVLPTDWFYDAVMYVYSRGLMNGVSDTSFDPYGTLNRAMVVTILYRLEGEPETELSSFKDVEEGKWYTNAIGWGAANEIVEGYDEDRFGPLDPVTREQLAAILYRYAQYKGYDVTAAADLSTYTDADSIHEYALEAMAWAVELGAPTAVTETTLEPRVNATRAQVAEAFMNFCEKYVPLATEGEEA